MDLHQLAVPRPTNPVARERVAEIMRWHVTFNKHTGSRSSTSGSQGENWELIYSNSVISKPGVCMNHHQDILWFLHLLYSLRSSNHPFRIVHYKPSSYWGIPILGNPHKYMLQVITVRTHSWFSASLSRCISRPLNAWCPIRIQSPWDTTGDIMGTRKPWESMYIINSICFGCVWKWGIPSNGQFDRETYDNPLIFRMVDCWKWSNFGAVWHDPWTCARILRLFPTSTSALVFKNEDHHICIRWGFGNKTWLNQWVINHH